MKNYQALKNFTEKQIQVQSLGHLIQKIRGIHLTTLHANISSSLGTIPVSIVLPIVSERTAPNGVHNNKEDKEYNVDNGHLLPVTLNVVEQSSLARLTVEAQNSLVIIPCIAV